MKIAAVRLNHPIAVAPMEEHTNYPFRPLAKRHGASLVCSERMDAVDVARRQRRALRMLDTNSQDAFRQLAGQHFRTIAASSQRAGAAAPPSR